MKVPFDTDETIEKLIQENNRLLLNLAYHYTNNMSEAEDIVQESFINFFTKNRKFDLQDDQAVKAWLIRITINRCKDFLRSAWHRKTIPIDEKTNDVESPDTPGVSAENSLLEDVMKLPKKYRAVIYLHYYEGYKFTEISKLLGVNEKTINTWHNRAKKLLQESVNDSDSVGELTPERTKGHEMGKL